MMRPSWNGPRSLTRTTTDLPLSRLVTRAKLGSGSDLCAAVNAYMSYTSRFEVRRPWRSEEHTSELQSLMRTSYAVFCLKKKTKTQDNDTVPVLICHHAHHNTH